MKRILNGLDYIFYRTAKAYFKWDGKSGITAFLSTSLFLAMTIIVPALLSIEKSFINKNNELFKGIVIGILIIMIIIVNIRYRKKYDLLHERFKMENEKTRKIRGLFVVISLLFPWILLFVGSIILK